MHTPNCRVLAHAAECSATKTIQWKKYDAMTIVIAAAVASGVVLLFTHAARSCDETAN